MQWVAGKVWVFVLLMVSVLSLTGIPCEAAEDSRVINLRAGTKSGNVLPKTTKSFSIVSKRSGRADLEAKCDRIRVTRRLIMNQEMYDVIDIDGGTRGWGEIGDPDLPVYTEEIQIPAGAKPRLVIDNVTFTDVQGEFEVAPVQELMPDLQGFDESKIRFRKNKNAYARDRFGNDPVVKLAKIFRVRGKEYALIEYRPVKYNPLKKQLRVATDADWHIEYTPVSTKTRRHDRQRAPSAGGLDIRPEADAAIEDATIESDPVLPQEAPAPEAGASSAQECDYLIICADNFKEEIQPLADWRIRTGLKVYVAGYPSEVGSGENNIFNYIQSTYSSGEMTRYVLIVGDHEDVPSYEIIGHPYHGDDHVWHTDLKYACVDGTDDFPDLALGRFPCDTESQVTLMVNKVLTYEKSPPSGDWIKHMLGAGQDQEERWFEEDIHRVCDFMGGDFDFYGSWNGYSGTDPFNKGYTTHVAVNGYLDPYRDANFNLRLQPPVPTPASWKANGTAGATQISGWINNGVGFVMHRDHGYSGGWGTPGYNTANVSALSNGQKTPVVFSINCQTGQFDNGDTFAEAWIRNANGGAVALMGHQRVSWSGNNDTLHVGIMDSIWNDYSSWDSSIYPNSRKLGEINNYSKHSVGFDAGTRLVTAQMFNLLGDPAMEFRAEIPKTLSATHPSSLTKGQVNNFTINVKSSGVNLQGATVCLSDSSEQVVKTTDSNGNVSFSITPEGLDVLNVTVTDTDALPYLGSINKVIGGIILEDETFETGVGNWINVSSGDTHNWTRDSGGTPSTSTGPSTGANGSTWYMYMETSDGSGAFTSGNSAILEGPNVSNADMLSFCYHMYGANMGTLNVDVYDGAWHNGVWTISGQQHTSNAAAYTDATVDLSAYSGTIKVRFRAVAIGGWQGDVAIDDIKITGKANAMPGLLAEFFDYTTSLSVLPNLSGKTPDMVRTDTQINYPSTTGLWSGLPSTMTDTFASRHTGQIHISTAGSYTFYLSSDDGSKLWIDDTLLINNDGLHGMTELSSTISLTPGKHTIRVEFFENTGGAGLIFRWAGPGIAKQVVPASVLYLPEDLADPGLWYGTVPGDINIATANPKTKVTTSLSETEDAIAGNTTEIYTGQIFDADGHISFTEDIDDRTRLYIDGVLVISSDNWTDRISTADLNLTPGWHDFELRISNGGGGSGPHSAPGFGYDPNGGTSWVHPSDPGDGSLFMALEGSTPPVNTPPVANAQSVTTAEDTAKNITLTGSDADGDSLTYAIVTSPAHGTLSGTGANRIYTPTVNYNGSDSFTFRVNDGTVNSANATVSINVTAVNDAPVANPQIRTATEDTAKAITLTGSDVDGDALTYTIGSQPSHGSLSGSGASRTYTPASNYNGPDSFTFRVNDGTVNSANATVSISVAAVNDAPTANAQSVTTAENTAKAITLSGSDVDGDSLTYAIVTQPTHGTLSGSGANLTYTPTANYSGSDSFTFRVNDGSANSANATVSITVTPVAGSTPYFEWDAAADTGGNNQWPSTTGNAFTWVFDAGNQTPVNVSDARFSGLIKAYTFPGAKDENMTSFDTFGSTEKATFEFVLDIDTESGTIFETGGVTYGIRFDVKNGKIRGTIAGVEKSWVSYELTEPDTNRFIHAVFVADNENDLFSLYIDGDLKMSSPWTDNDDWSGSNASGLGGTDSGTPDGNDSGNFEGQIAVFRYYRNTALTSAEVSANFDALSSDSSLNVEIDGVTQSAEILSYGGASQDISGSVTMLDDGDTLQISGNTWKMIDLNSIEITEDTVISLQFSSSKQGEVQGILFDTDTVLSPEYAFQFYGTQIWGFQQYRTYADSAPGVVTYTIPVGTFYTGTFRYLAFMCDHDAAPSDAEAVFSNVRISSDGVFTSTLDMVVTCDNTFDLYINGALMYASPSYDPWEVGKVIQNVELLEGENVVAIKGMDAGGAAALLAELSVDGERIGTDSDWKVSLTAPAGWTEPGFNDSDWSLASTYGAYGVSPWGTRVSSMPVDTPAKWIWSSDNSAHDTVYFRYTLHVGQNETIWVDESVPAGAALAGSWVWIAGNPSPFSGKMAHRSTLASGTHQHYFNNATETLEVGTGDTLFTYVYLDPANPPTEVMLQFNDGSWEHRAYWGANSIALGSNGTNSRRSMGALPPVGKWVRLEVPAALVGLEGSTLNGMAFTLYGGQAVWDRTGCSAPDLQPGLWYGTVAGNINTATENPAATITTDLSETENAIAVNTTEIYTGQIFDGDGHISFTEDMDDKTRLYIDGVLVISSDNWTDRISTGDLNLAPGWHDFELRISNGTGGSGPHTAPGFGYDPNGGTSWIHPSDPGNGTLFRAKFAISVESAEAAPSVSDEYYMWAVENGVIGTMTDDDDGDGRNNLYEYALGGNPTNAIDAGVAPVLSRTGDTFTFTHLKRNDDPDLVYSLETRTDLLNGSWAPASFSTETNVIGGAYDEVSYEIPVGDPNLYIRLRIMLE